MKKIVHHKFLNSISCFPLSNCKHNVQIDKLLGIVCNMKCFKVSNNKGIYIIVFTLFLTKPWLLVQIFSMETWNKKFIFILTFSWHFFKNCYKYFYISSFRSPPINPSWFFLYVLMSYHSFTPQYEQFMLLLLTK